MTIRSDDDCRQKHVDADRPVIPLFWTHRDQWSIAVATGLCMFALGIWYMKQGGWERIHWHERVTSPQPVRLQLDGNTTTWPELTLVDGIGETLARRIIEQRDKHGVLTQQNLAEVHGIGDAKLAALLQYLAVESANEPSMDTAPTSN